MCPCFKRKYETKKKKKGDLNKYMYTAPIEGNKKKKKRRDRTAILRGHPSHVKVYSFAGQRMYLHFSVILRPWVLVRPRESNPRPSVLQLSALPAELALPRVSFVFLRSFRSVFSVIGLLQWAVISSIFNSWIHTCQNDMVTAWLPGNLKYEE